jgi:hypothetical protein
MLKEEYITRYGIGSYKKQQKQTRNWIKEHPKEVGEFKKKWEGSQVRNGGKYYTKTQCYKRTGIQGRKNKVRKHHSDIWRKYKNIIAPGSQIHHEWIPGTANYRGVALVEADQHIHGVIKVIEVLGGEITLLREVDIRNA